MTDSIQTGLTILVSGATGNQGGAVASALLKSGHRVRALTRNLESTRAKALALAGAEVVAGDMNDNDSIRTAMRAVDTFYLMGSPFEGGVDAETEQGMRLATLARDEGIGHLVYGSVASADRATAIPHFDSKFRVEQHIQSLGVNYSVSAPVYFMDNLIAPWSIDALKFGKIEMAMPPDVLLQQISVQNIGEFVASLVGRREAVFGKRYDIAADELTGDAMSKAVGRKMNREIEYKVVPIDTMKQQDADMGRMFEWFTETGYSVDLSALHAVFTDVPWQSYGAWLDGLDARVYE